MTRVALVSDIHANFEALAAVLHDASLEGVDRVVCLGDVVGYGPDPGACIDLIASRAHAMVCGNHDLAVVRPELRNAMNERAQASIDATRRMLQLRHLSLLESLSTHRRVGSLLVTHASFGANPWEYVYNAEQAAVSFSGLDARVGAFGHTHVPGIFIAPYQTLPDPASIRIMHLDGDHAVSIPDGCRVLLNPGSVGQPRDGNPAASWGLLDLNEMTFGIRRVPYDVDAVTDKIGRLGLPVAHAERLRIGA